MTDNRDGQISKALAIDANLATIQSSITEMLSSAFPVLTEAPTKSVNAMLGMTGKIFITIRLYKTRKYARIMARFVNRGSMFCRNL